MSFRFDVLIALIALLGLALLAPQIAGALFYNLANVQLAHASALPTDAPLRTSELDSAELELDRATGFSAAGRVPLAQTRIDMARGQPALAASRHANADAALRGDPIALFDWGQAAWDSGASAVAFDRWRAAGAYVFFDQEMHRASDQHQWQAAAQFARIAVGIDPSSADAHYVLADALAQQNVDDAQVLPELDRARQLTVDREFLSTIISRRGEVLAARGDLQGALDAFDQARAQAPIDARPRTDYALVLVKLDPGRRDQAVQLLTQVTKDSPWYTAAYIALADFADADGQSDLAQRWLMAGLDHNPGNPDMLFALGQYYSRHDRIGDAGRYMTMALAAETRADRLLAISAALHGLSGQ